MSKDWKAYERATASDFTEAYYPAGDGEFRRVSAFHQAGGFGKDMVGGDLAAIKFGLDSATFLDASFPFSIECKNWKEENVRHFFTGLYAKDSVLFDWMEQSIADAERFKKIPLVVFRLYRQKSVAMLRATDFSKLKEMFGEPDFKYYFLRRYFQGHSPLSDLLVFVLLKEFIVWIDWEVYKFSGRKFIRSVVKK